MEFSVLDDEGMAKALAAANATLYEMKESKR